SLPISPEAIAEAEAAKIERRTIRLGRDAWDGITKAETFEAWKAIGAALAVGKGVALRATGVNQAWGRAYSRVFGQWMQQHGFATMPKSTRSVAIELYENCAAIEQWRATLDERDRRGLKHPLSNVRRWKASLTHGNGKCPQDLKREATAAWRRF